MESLQKTVTLSTDTLRLIHERKICPALDCYRALTGRELKKDNRFCFRHHNSSQVLPHHCGKCGTILHSKRVRRPQGDVMDVFMRQRYCVIENIMPEFVR